MSEHDQGMRDIRVRFADGLEETRYVPGVVGDCVKLEIAWRAEPVVFERDNQGVYVERADGECDEPARRSTNASISRRMMSS